MLSLRRFKTIAIQTCCHEIKDIQRAVCLPAYAVI